MIITAFGGLFLPFSFFVFLFRRAWLLPLLCVAAVLHSPSVANVGWGDAIYGVTPFLWVSGLVTIDLLWRWRRRGRLTLGQGDQRRLLRLWLAFGALAVLGALLLPWVFQGVDVHVPLDKDGLAAGPAPLHWSINHFAQALNVALMMVTMLWVAQQHRDPGLGRRVWLGVVAALAVSLLVGLQQRLGWNGLMPLWEDFWASNPSYDQKFRSWAGPVPRVAWPFVEASYGSAWYAALFGGFSAMFLANIKRNRTLLGALVALFALGNSLGATGMLTIVLYACAAIVVALGVAWRQPAIRGALAYRLSLAALVGTCLALATFLVLRHYGLLDDAGGTLRAILARWSGQMLGQQRLDADGHALKLVVDTWGLGVGMGSNRASSYVATLLGNTGLVGFALFFAALFTQCWMLAQARSPAAVFFLGSTVAGLIAVVIAIPDQNWPAFWILLLGGLACLGSDRPATDAARHPA